MPWRIKKRWQRNLTINNKTYVMSSLQKRLIKNKKLKSYKKLQIALRKAKQKPGAPAL